MKYICFSLLLIMVLINNTDILMKWGVKRQCKTSSKNFKHNTDAKPQIDKERENHSLEPQFQNHTPK